MNWRSIGITKRQGGLSLSCLGVASLLFVGSTIWIKQHQVCLPQAPTPTSSSSHPTNPGLSLLLYNAQLRSRLIFSSGQSHRAQRLGPLLNGYDVIVLSEVFDDYPRKQLLAALPSHYRYISHSVGQNKGLAQDSGLTIVSRWPIEPETRIKPQFQQLFKHCDGISCFSEQGILTVRINKNGMYYRLLTAQFQGGSRPKAQAIRAEQIQHLQTFVKTHGLLSGAPMIFAVSLPIAKHSQLNQFKQQLAKDLNLTPFQPSEPSVDPTQNPLAQTDVPLTPDVLFTFNAQQQPQETQIEVKPLRVPQEEGWKSGSWMYWQCPQQNLSDHHAVEAALEYANE